MNHAVAANIYKVEVPLPEMPIQSVNAYIIKSPDRNLIVDSGLVLDGSIRTMEESLTELDVDLRKTDFFITHYHRDHLDMVSHLATDTSTIYLSQVDEHAFRNGGGLFGPDPELFSRRSGFPRHLLEEAIDILPALAPIEARHLRFRHPEHGDTICIGGYRLECVSTPGHSRGHMCLYDPSKGLFFAGDHILNDISPTIQGRFNDEDPLGEYFTSLDKVYALDVNLVLPGHRGIFHNCRKRIEEIKAHHHERNLQIVTLLKEGRKNICQLASQMTWSVEATSWSDFSALQKFLAIGETISHVQYLEKRRTVAKALEGEEFIYSLDPIAAQ